MKVASKVDLNIKILTGIVEEVAWVSFKLIVTGYSIICGNFESVLNSDIRKTEVCFRMQKTKRNCNTPTADNKKIGVKVTNLRFL